MHAVEHLGVYSVCSYGREVPRPPCGNEAEHLCGRVRRRIRAHMCAGTIALFTVLRL